MRVTPMRELLASQPVLRGLEASDLDLIAGCARNDVVAAGTFLAHDDEPADRFFVVRAGLVGLQLPTATGALVLETLGAGELVGFSWIFPPYRWVCDVVAMESTRLVSIEAVCLRDKCDADPAFGYRMMTRFAEVVVGRLNAARLRLLDLYGAADVR
jgi:CRP-like cAMP-binding protein